jgi:hypothetical protein
MHSTTRTLVLEHEQAAGAPWVTSLPSHPGFIATNAAIFASEVLVAYEMKKRHDWLPGGQNHPKIVVDVSSGNVGASRQECGPQHQIASSGGMYQPRLSIALVESPQATSARAIALALCHDPGLRDPLRRIIVVQVKLPKGFISA